MSSDWDGPLARRAVMNMKAYLPPLEGRRFKVRLDFNENTVGFTDLVPQLEPTLVTAYPEYSVLLTRLAAHLGIPEDYLLITNGSDEALFVAAFTFVEADQDLAIVSAPTFSLIPHYLQLCQARLEEVIVHDDLSFDLEALEKAFEKNPKVAILPSPDNPTGGVIPLDVLERWLTRFPRTAFVIDEAYYEYHQVTAVGLLTRYKNLIISRTFSKAWGLAGLRMGLLMAHPQICEWMRRVRSPYSVNSMAVQTLIKFLPEKDRVLAQCAEVVERKQRVLARVRELGYRVTPGAANFFLIWAGLASKLMASFFSERGMLVRDRSSLAKMGGSVRVSVGSEDEMIRFQSLLEQFGRRFAFIFDLDDTLVDTSLSYDETIVRLTGAERHQVHALRAEGGFNDDWEAAHELLRRSGVTRTLADVEREGKEIYLKLAAEGLEQPHFQSETLELIGRRHPLFIFTGRPRDEYDPVWGARLQNHFGEVLCKGDLEHVLPKPSPTGLLHLVQKYDLIGGAYVGNSVDDMAAAKAANLFAIGVTTNQTEAALRAAGADLVVEKFDDLLELLLLKGWTL